MNKEKIRQIAAKVLQGKATKEEQNILHKWYDQKKMVEGEEIRIAGHSPKNRMYKNIVKQMPQKVDVYKPGPHLSTVKWLWAAAAILVMILSYSVFYFTVPHKSVEWIAVTVPLGKMKKIILPDSSIVWLNAGSQLRYPAHFSESERRVEITEGQAFFEVQKNKNRPFKVTVHELLVTVLGTSFEVKSFFDEKNAEVGVQTGLVNISYKNHNEKTSLHPGDLAFVNKSSGELDLRTQTPQSIGSWKENRLEFNGELLGVVTNALERKYDVNFSIDNQVLLDLPVTIKLDHQPLENILEVLGYSLGFNYEVSENGKIIKIFKE
ncbi:FecR family protein [Membranicola marinus]|uniref:FecR family protein n=1 Tax=Membranihabitans marinus TaxID=1227546 RepID=A0A953HVE0_9BACT|nr:FecR family protein [Membranihabitans marinus]MBY5958548.1 FecR family protein [Membranihabitans marinus]